MSELEIRELERAQAADPTPGGYMVLRAALRRGGRASWCYLRDHLEALWVPPESWCATTAKALRSLLRRDFTRARVRAGKDVQFPGLLNRRPVLMIDVYREHVWGLLGVMHPGARLAVYGEDTTALGSESTYEAGREQWHRSRLTGRDRFVGDSPLELEVHVHNGAETDAVGQNGGPRIPLAAEERFLAEILKRAP